jgi:hypothetical protein
MAGGCLARAEFYRVTLKLAAGAEAIAQRFGPAAVDGKIQAHIVSIEN